MTSVLRRVVWLALMVSTTEPSVAMAQAPMSLPSPLSLADVVRLAHERRDEVVAARARTRAGAQRPAIVSALANPMVSPSLDHLPFMWSGADVSVTVEQQIPLSGVRRHRRGSALADVERLRADVRRTGLDVGLQAAHAARATSSLYDVAPGTGARLATGLPGQRAPRITGIVLRIESAHPCSATIFNRSMLVTMPTGSLPCMTTTR